MPGHDLRPWASQVRSCSELLSPRCSLDHPPTPAKIASLAQTFVTCRGREGRQDLAMGRHAWHADLACSWWAEAGVCPSWAPLQTGWEKAGSEAERPEGTTECGSLRTPVGEPRHAKDPRCHVRSTSSTGTRLLLTQPQTTGSELEVTAETTWSNLRPHHTVVKVAAQRSDIQQTTRSC